jgi:hypothetical protein
MQQGSALTTMAAHKHSIDDVMKCNKTPGGMELNDCSAPGVEVFFW